MRARHSASLLGACRRGEWELVESILNKRADINACGDHGETPLLIAAKRAEAEACAELLRLRANPDMHDALQGSTALMLACCSKRDTAAAVVRGLLKASADVHARNHQLQTALMVAAASGVSSCLTVLLDHGADVNDVASAASNLPQADDLDPRVVKEILFDGRQVAEKSTPEPVIRFLSSVAPLRKEDRPPPPLSREERLTARIQAAKLRGMQCNPQGCGDTALVAAARANQVDACRILLAARADANIRGGDQAIPLSVSAIQGHIEVCSVLLASTKLEGRRAALAEAERFHEHAAAALLSGEVTS
mmetsp:Transcript_13863/g.25480  ORF Transcript_13863/g.25480 Transcript_13863/m.25480 type:complete len:307 (-) Transcript_13863:95-1015(-)